MSSDKHNVIKKHNAEINTAQRRAKVVELLQRYGDSITDIRKSNKDRWLVIP